MAELITAVHNIKVEDFLTITENFNYHLPEHIVETLKNRLDDIVNIVYADEFCTETWAVKSNSVFVNRDFSYTLLVTLRQHSVNTKLYAVSVDEYTEAIFTSLEQAKAYCENHRRWLNTPELFNILVYRLNSTNNENEDYWIPDSSGQWQKYSNGRE